MARNEIGRINLIWEQIFLTPPRQAIIVATQLLYAVGDDMSLLRDGLLVGFGNPLLDISTHVDADFLEKYGLQDNAMIFAEEKHLLIYKELVEKHNADFIVGGSVQNSFRVCQWIIARPNVTTIFGCCGNDDYARIVAEKTRSDGVNVQYQLNGEHPTGTCAVLITGTNRSLCTNLGAAKYFTLDFVQRAENLARIEAAAYFYISGFFITVSPETILFVAEKALQQDAPFMMNLSADFICQFFAEPLLRALPYIDFLFGNEVEAVAFARHCLKRDVDENAVDLREIAMQIADMPKLKKDRPRIVVITQHTLPVILAYDGKLSEFPIDPLEPERIKDTNGAGDAFVGGFLAQFVQRKSLETCVRCGIWAAREIIQRSGCTFDGKPSFQK